MRKSAASDLAKFDGTSEPRRYFTALQLLGEESRTDNSVVYDRAPLTFCADSELSAVRPDLETSRSNQNRRSPANSASSRLIAADKDVDQAWTLAQNSVTPLRDLLEAVPLIRDLSVRASLYSKIEPLLDTLPPAIAAMKTEAVRGRYVRIELPGDKRTLTLAEVEVWGGARNVALGGKATQKNTSNNGDASRAIDGNTSGKYADGGQRTPARIPPTRGGKSISAANGPLAG